MNQGDKIILSQDYLEFIEGNSDIEYLQALSKTLLFHEAVGHWAYVMTSRCIVMVPLSAVIPLVRLPI